MEGYAILLFVVAVTVAAVAYSRVKNSLETIESLENETKALREELRQITRRLLHLEKIAESAAQESQRPATTVAEVAKPQSVPVTPAPVAPPPVVPASVVTSPPPPAPPRPETFVPPVTHPASPTRIEVPPPPPSSWPPIPGPTLHAANSPEPRKWAEIEEVVGTSWLNKIGTAAFVIGVALLLNYSMHYLGPVGKIALGYVLAAIFLAVGIYGEKKERYRIAARAVMGGGWALAYFTTYAMHNIAMVRIVESPGLGFALLFLVAAAMVAHSLLYNSEVTTGFAYLLAFVSVGVGQIPLGGLVATVLLAASLAVILRMRQWFVLEPLAIAATYLLHWMWLNQVYERIGGHKPFPQFAASICLLTAYWGVYLASYFLRDARNENQTRLLTTSFFLNAAGYLILLHYQSFHPEWRFWFLLGAGTVYLVISGFSRKFQKHVPFLLASTLGVALLLAAIPYRYSGGRLEILWLIEAEVFLIAGWGLADSHLRRLGWAGSAALTIYVLWHDIAPRLSAWQEPNATTGWLLAALAIAFYFNARWEKRWGEPVTQLDEVAALISPVVATGFALAAAWIGLPIFWPGLVWALLAAGLLETGMRWEDRTLRICGHLAAASAAVRLLAVNMVRADSWHNVSLRLITVGASCAVLYLVARRATPAPASVLASGETRTGEFSFGGLERFGGLPAAYTGTATLLVSLLLWNEVTTAAVAMAWGLFGLALLESSRSLQDRPLQVQAYLVLAASFARIFIADLNSTAHLWRLPAPVVTVTLLVAIYYYAGVTSEFSRIRSGFLWLGTAALAALFRFEFALDWVAVSWAALAVALYFLGRFSKSATLRNQSYAITLLAAVRCGLYNFYRVEPWHFTTVRVATVMASALLLYILFVVTQFSRRTQNDSEAPPKQQPAGQLPRIWSALESHPQRLFFFVPTILLTVLLSLEVRRGFLTAAWGLEALLVFLLVLKMDERVYRWFSLLLFFLCVGRVITVDVWNLDALGRIVSFLGLGAALLAVSFLYARHREVLRKVL